MPRFSPFAGSRLFLLLLLLLAALAAPAAPHAADAPQQGVLLVAFGTSVPEALPAMQAVDQEFKQAFPGQPVVWAYTSQIIRKKIAAQRRPRQTRQRRRKSSARAVPARHGRRRIFRSGTRRAH